MYETADEMCGCVCLDWTNLWTRLLVDDVNSGFANGFTLLPHTLLRGYDAVTWMVVCNLAFTGLLVSWIMKFADTIVKVYSTSMAMMVTMVVSVFVFDIAPNLQLVLGIITASMSLQLYYINPLDLLPSTSRPGEGPNGVRVDKR